MSGERYTSIGVCNNDNIRLPILQVRQSVTVRTQERHPTAQPAQVCWLA